MHTLSLSFGCRRLRAIATDNGKQEVPMTENHIPPLPAKILPSRRTRNRHVFRTSIVAAEVFFVGVILQAVPALANARWTYDLIWHAYCEAGTTTVCGEPTLNDFTERVRGEMHTLNEIFRPTKVSFRLAGIIVVHDSTLAAIPRFCGDDSAPYEPAMEAEAAADPTRIHWFGSQHSSNGCVRHVPSPGGDGPYAVFGNALSGGNHRAHELGHFFCLPHPFTFEDPADDSPVNHDGDGISDTPPDPGLFEGYDPEKTGRDEDAWYWPIADHEWCNWNQHFDVDPGSFYGRYCTLDCGLYNGTSFVPTSWGTDSELIMSYYKSECSGPYTRNGQRTEAFSFGSVLRIADCIGTVPQRQSLVDVCGDQYGGDLDHDGICDNVDVCPLVYNETIADQDHDGVWDDCDNCPTVFNPNQSDQDQDWVGDLCDADLDGDGCNNAVDDDPGNAMQTVGTYHYIGPCGSGDETALAPAGEDTDGDTILNCSTSSSDDDGDGTPDSEDPCPTIYGTDPLLCYWPVLGDCPPELVSCAPLCDFGIFAKLWWVINPSDFIDFPSAAILGNTSHLGSTAPVHASTFSLGISPEMATSLAVQSFEGTNFGAEGTPRAGEDTLVLGVWSRDETEPMAILAEFSPGDVEFVGDIRRGRSVVVEVESLRDRQIVRVRGSWGPGFPTEGAQDRDRDGVPDTADNCLETSNPGQADRDRDRIGDACDPDFNQDGVVSDSEVELVRDCARVDPHYIPPYSQDEINQSFPSQAEIARARRCAGADLNGDSVIDDADADLAAALAGMPPGPSGLMAAYADCLADINDDGVVNKEDLEIFALNFGRTDCALAACPGDLDEDGVVDGVDLWISTPAVGGSGCREEAD